VIKDTAGNAVAFGEGAGTTSQGNAAVAIGKDAGTTTQGQWAVAIGTEAGNATQGAGSVAIGLIAGSNSQGVTAVAVGPGAGYTTQGNNAVAIGYNAGSNTQGQTAVAIGYNAGRTSQGNNSIILNATGANLNQTTANTFTVKPVRQASTANAMYYDASTGEITYDTAGGGSTGNVTFDDQAVVGTGDQVGGSGLYLAPGTESVGNLQYIRVRGGDVATHIHLDTGNNAYFDQYFGSDIKYVKLEAAGNVQIGSDDDTGNSAQWTFGTDGNLTFPRDAVANTDPILTIVGGANPSITLTDASLAGPANLAMSVDYLNLSGFTGNKIVAYPDQGLLGADANLVLFADFANAGNTNSYWTFDTTGNLTTPGNLVIGPGPGSGSSIFQYNEGLQILGEGANSVVQLGWTANTSAPDSVTTIAMNYPSGGEGNILIAVGNNATTVNYWLFDNTGNLTLPGNTFAVNYANNTPVDVVTRFESSWTVPVGNSTQNFTVSPSNTYYMWVDCNIPNGILTWNATATVTNTNVPVVGAQYAWVYSGGGTPIDFTSIPDQFVGTSNTIVRSSVSPSATTNRFDFGINNTSGNAVAVRYGWIQIS
jgi:hypothetical protein